MVGLELGLICRVWFKGRLKASAWLTGPELVVNNANYGPEAVACKDKDMLWERKNGQMLCAEYVKRGHGLGAKGHRQQDVGSSKETVSTNTRTSTMSYVLQDVSA